MVLFPIAFLWVAIFLIWVIRRSNQDMVDPPETGPDQPRRRPQSPRGGPRRPTRRPRDRARSARRGRRSEKL